MRGRRDHLGLLEIKDRPGKGEKTHPQRDAREIGRAQKLRQPGEPAAADVALPLIA